MLAFFCGLFLGMLLKTPYRTSGGYVGSGSSDAQTPPTTGTSVKPPPSRDD